MGVLNRFHNVSTPVFFKNVEEVQALGRSAAPKAWHLPFLQIKETDGTGVRVGILDSGAYLSHPSLRGPSITPVSLSPFGSYSYGEHGTAVMSLLVGNGHKGLKGLCPEAEVFSYPVLSKYGSGSMSRVEKALENCFHSGMDVINISLGSTTEDKQVRKWLDRLLRRGTLIVAAGGNNGLSGGVMWPARHPGIISVGSVNAFGEMSSFSSSQDLGDIDIVAPGDKILVATNHEGAGLMSGTSFASPIVTGACASLKSRGINVTYSRIKDTAIDILSPGVDSESGFGLFSPANLEYPLPPA